uniref:Uncharacterized protein n=3 Tax=Avena sativa TaxID=4498 RepID=A0ACD5VZ57_AVESA
MDGWHNKLPGNCRKELMHNLAGCPKEASPLPELWTGGLVCAFEFVRGHGFASPPNLSRNNSSQYPKDLSAMDPKKLPVIQLGNVPSCLEDGEEPRPQCKHHGKASPAESYWAPIGWSRIGELVEMVEGDYAAWDGQGMSGLMDGVDDGQCCDITVADVATPYWQRPAGPTWWCHVTAGHPAVDAWLADARLWRKYVFGAADEIELKFVNRRNQEDLNLLCIIFNQDIRRLATQVIRVKWSLHAREEIMSCSST